MGLQTQSFLSLILTSIRHNHLLLLLLWPFAVFCVYAAKTTTIIKVKIRAYLSFFKYAFIYFRLLDIFKLTVDLYFFFGCVFLTIRDGIAKGRSTYTFVSTMLTCAVARKWLNVNELNERKKNQEETLKVFIKSCWKTRHFGF